MNQTLLEHILNVSRRMAEMRTLHPLLAYVLDEAVKLVGAERGYIVLLNADGSLNLQVKRSQKNQTTDDTKDQISTTIIKEVIETTRPLILRDAMSDPRFGSAESVVMFGLRSIMCVPLITRGNAIGALYVENRSIRGRFSDDDLPPLILLANQAAVAIENASLIEGLEEKVAARTHELEQAKQQVEQSWAETIEANRMRTVWLSKIIHDLRAPLGISSASLSFLQEGGLGSLNDQQLEWIDKSLKSMMHMADLINDLFDLSKLEIGGITLHKEIVSLEEFMENVYDLGQGIVWSPDVKFLLDITPPLPQVYIDPVRIRQVLLNLLSNAQKFTRQGQVRLYAYQTGPGEAVLGVADSGEGIAPNKLKQLFERFQQADDNPERQRQGSGLGLAICRALVEMHGGRIWVESNPNAGADFCFTLPLHPPDSSR